MVRWEEGGWGEILQSAVVEEVSSEYFGFECGTVAGGGLSLTILGAVGEVEVSTEDARQGCSEQCRGG